MYASVYSRRTGIAYPRAESRPPVAGEENMQICVALTREAHAFMNVDEAARLHASLGAALVEAGKVTTP